MEKGEYSYRLFPWIKNLHLLPKCFSLLVMNRTLIIRDKISNRLIVLYWSSIADVFGCWYLVSSVCGMLGRVKGLDVRTWGASRLADDPCAASRALTSLLATATFPLSRRSGPSVTWEATESLMSCWESANHYTTTVYYCTSWSSL